MKGMTDVVNIRLDKELKDELNDICKHENISLSSEFRGWVRDFIDRKSLVKDPEKRQLRKEFGRLNTLIRDKRELIKKTEFEIKCLETQAEGYYNLIEKRNKELDKNGKKH